MLAQLWEHTDAGGSLRGFAAARGLVPSTVSYQVRRAMAATREPTWARFVETPGGLRLVHRIVLAAMYVITQCCGGGIRQVCEFLVRSGLSDVVASGYGSVQRAVKAMEEVIAFGEAEHARRGSQMKPKSITLAEDETFHGGAPCLVAMDVVSNFLLVEEYAPGRKADTWTSVANEALAGLPVDVEQCVVDGARPCARTLSRASMRTSCRTCFMSGRTSGGPLRGRSDGAWTHPSKSCTMPSRLSRR